MSDSNNRVAAGDPVVEAIITGMQDAAADLKANGVVKMCDNSSGLGDFQAPRIVDCPVPSSSGPKL